MTKRNVQLVQFSLPMTKRFTELNCSVITRDVYSYFINFGASVPVFAAWILKQLCNSLICLALNFGGLIQ